MTNKIENRVISVNQFKCRGKKEDGTPAFEEDKDSQTVILQTYENGKSVALCSCNYMADGRCNYQFNKAGDSKLDLCPYTLKK